MNNVEDNRELMTVLEDGSMFKLMVEAIRIQSKCEDFTVSNKDFSMTEHKYIMGVDIHKDINISDDLRRFNNIRNFGLTPHSFSQICTKVGVPVRYMNKCYENKMDFLVTNNINSWLGKEENKSTLIRTYGDNIRGILSDKFSILDTPDIIKVLDKSISMSEYKVKSYFLNEERLHIRLIQREMLNIQGEDLFAGIQIDSSDVGRSTLVVQFFIFKQVCTNGLVVPKESSILFKQRHIGISQEEFRMNLVEGLKRVPELIEEYKYNIENARMVNYTKDIIDKKLIIIKEDITLADNHIEKLNDLVGNTYGRTKWGLVNAVTDLAKDFTLERRIELERYAGKLLIA